jgi:hypothetical protein
LRFLAAEFPEQRCPRKTSVHPVHRRRKHNTTAPPPLIQPKPTNTSKKEVPKRASPRQHWSPSPPSVSCSVSAPTTPNSFMHHTRPPTWRGSDLGRDQHGTTLRHTVDHAGTWRQSVCGFILSQARIREEVSRVSSGHEHVRDRTAGITRRMHTGLERVPEAATRRFTAR